jgi:flagellar hook protein FlgE
MLNSVTGMLNSQVLLDVTSNNIANSDTPGFRASRVSFADQMYDSYNLGGPGQGGSGGTNPLQSGRGSMVSTIDRLTTQGSVDPTGSSLDMAITGDGFFRLQGPDGGEAYTRVGHFGFDGGANLVDLASGLRVLNTQGSTIPLVSSLPATATTHLDLTGNLPATDVEPLHGQKLNSLFPLARRDGGTVSSSTPLADLTICQNAPGGALPISIFGTEPDGTLYGGTVTLPAGATVQDLLDGINQTFTTTLPTVPPTTRRFADATFAHNQITASATDPGSSLSLFIGEAPAPTAPISDATASTWQYGTATDSFSWNQLRFAPSSVASSATIYSADGTPHTLDVRYLNTGTDATGQRVWDMIVGAPAAGRLTPGSGSAFSGITFDGSGALTAAPTGTLDVTWDVGGASSLTVATGGLSGFASDAAVDILDPTGHPAGSLTEVTVDETGRILGTYSNGITQAMSATNHQVGLAEFSNPGGLLAAGNNLWTASANSGAPNNIASDQAGSGQRITGGALESSNVDISGEFTRLILAQRGFQTNSKAFQIADQMLQDANNLVR